MTLSRSRAAALTALTALAIALFIGILGTSAQAPPLEVPPLPHEEGAVAIRGDGTPSDDGVHLVTSGGTDGYVLEGGELRVEDEDGSFEVRAYVIGDDGATATVYVRTPDGEVVRQAEIYIGCPEADECMSASDFHVDAGSGGTWHVDVEYGEGEHGAWQLEIYREVASEVLFLPIFPAPPVHAIRGNGQTLPDGRRLRVTDSNSDRETVADGALIIEDEDGNFEIVAYLEGPDQAVAEVNAYAGNEPSGTPVKSETVTISCPDADICLRTLPILVEADPGTYAVDIERVSGTLGPWQLEVYNYPLPAAGLSSGDAEDEEESDTLQPASGSESAEPADEDAMAEDAMAMPSGGTGGLLQTSTSATIPVAAALAGLITGLAILGAALRLRRNAA